MWCITCFSCPDLYFGVNFWLQKAPHPTPSPSTPLASSISQCSEDTSQNSGACSCTIACVVTVRRKKVAANCAVITGSYPYLVRIAARKASHSLPTHIFLSSPVRFVNQTKALVAIGRHHYQDSDKVEAWKGVSGSTLGGKCNSPRGQIQWALFWNCRKWTILFVGRVKKFRILSVIFVLLMWTGFVLSALILLDAVSWRRKHSHFTEHLCFEKNWNGLAQVKVIIRKV